MELSARAASMSSRGGSSRNPCAFKASCSNRNSRTTRAMAGSFTSNSASQAARSLAGKSNTSSRYGEIRRQVCGSKEDELIQHRTIAPFVIRTQYRSKSVRVYGRQVPLSHLPADEPVALGLALSGEHNEGCA